MSIAGEIERITSAKDNIRTAIIAKGGTVSADALIDAYPAAISALPTSGGGSGSATATPTYTTSGGVLSDAGTWHNGVFGVSYEPGQGSIKSTYDFTHSGDLTVCGWMCRMNNDYSACVVFGDSYGADGNENWIFCNSNGIQWVNGAADDAPDRQEITLSSTIPVDQWHQFCFEYNATTSKCALTLDNTTSAIQSDTKTMVYEGYAPLGINNLPRSPGAVSMSGRYAHVQVFSRLLTAQEKASLAAEFIPTTS